jgi:peroxiredoxin/6-pyruvoyl-tetrahydropterin synthase
MVLCFVLPLLSQKSNGYEIKIQINGFKQKEIYMAYHLGEKQYIKDTIKQQADGSFLFKGDSPLESGIYLVVLPPDNNYFQLIIEKNDQYFSVTTDAADPSKNIQTKGSIENKLFYGYMNFLAEKRPQSEALNNRLKEEKDSLKMQELTDAIDKIDQEVEDFQFNFIQNNANTFTAAIIKANTPLKLPDFSGTEEEQQREAFYYNRDHYFDNLDLTDGRFLRTPFLFERINTYVSKLQVQVPDSLIKAIDLVLAKTKNASESYRYFAVHYLNEYANSKFVGMDAVYVHLAEKYYASGQAPWVDSTQLAKIVENAISLKPILIGKIAPNVKMQLRDGSPVTLHDIKSPYIVLYFWRYDCGHCKESTPDIKAFYEEYKNKGVKIFAVCVKFNDEIGDCWKYVDENQLDGWIHAVDPYLRSKFYSLYNVKTTPQIFILDKNKKIISKGIGAPQLKEVMGKIMEFDSKNPTE